MPEALAVVAVLAVTLVAWVGAMLHARNPANYSVTEEVERLRVHAVWLEQRLEVARREDWGSEMVTNLSDELAATGRELARLRAHSGQG